MYFLSLPSSPHTFHSMSSHPSSSPSHFHLYSLILLPSSYTLPPLLSVIPIILYVPLFPFRPSFYFSQMILDPGLHLSLPHPTPPFSERYSLCHIFRHCLRIGEAFTEWLACCRGVQEGAGGVPLGVINKGNFSINRRVPENYPNAVLKIASHPGLYILPEILKMRSGA